MAIISSKSDYHYCDLSGWSGNVGSDIYPLRDDDTKKQIRFCDLAFALEACLSRACIFAGVKINGSEIDSSARELYDKFSGFLSKSIKSDKSLAPSSSATLYAISDVSQFENYKEIGKKYSLPYDVSGAITIRVPNPRLINKRYNIYETNKPISTSESDSSSYYPEGIYAELAIFIQNFRSYPYFIKSIGVPVYSYATSGTGAPSSVNSICFETFNPSSTDRKSYEWYSYISEQLFSAEIIKPASGAIDLTYAVVLGVGQHTQPSKSFITTFSSLDGETCSREWIAKAREIFPDYELAIGGTGNNLIIKVYSIYVIAKSKEDVDYLTP